MELTEYTRKLQELAQEGAKKAIERVIVPAATELLADIKNRIIREGKGTDGNKIGNYSTKPIYATKEQFIQKGKFKGVGKDGFIGKRLVSEKKYKIVKRTLKSGKIEQRLVSENRYRVETKKPKTMFLEYGYKELRDIQGRETSFINMEYSGSLLLSYSLQANNNEVLIGFISEKSKLIRKANEKRFGAIFSATQEEKERYNKTVAENSLEITTSILNA